MLISSQLDERWLILGRVVDLSVAFGVCTLY